jgi:hypothetical protein
MKEGYQQPRKTKDFESNRASTWSFFFLNNAKNVEKITYIEKYLKNSTNIIVFENIIFIYNYYLK